MKKLVVRIFNILLIGAAAYAAVCFATKPLFEFEVSATIKKEAIGELAKDAINKDDSSEPEEQTGTNTDETGGGDTGNEQSGGDGGIEQGGGIDETPKAYKVTRDGTDSSVNNFDLKTALSPEKVGNAIGDIELSIPLSIDAKQCFDLKNEKVFNEIIIDNIKPIIDSTINLISPKFKNLVTSVTMDFAKDVMKQEVAKEVLKNFGEEIPVDEAKIDKLVDSVYEKLDKGDGQTTTVKELSNALIGDKNYVVVENPSAEDFAKKTYFVKTEEGEFVKAEAFEPETVYYVEEFNDGVRGILQDIQKQQEAEGKEVTQINYDEIDMTSIEEQMITALDNVPNLTQRAAADPQPTAENFADGVYYVKNDLGCFEIAKEYQTGVTYYAGEATISSIDDALIGLLDLLAGNVGNANISPTVEENHSEDEQGQGQQEEQGQGQQEEQGQGQQEQQVPEIMAARVQKADEQAGQSADRVTEKVESVIYKLIPFDEFYEKDLSIGGYAPLILFGLMLLGMLPWLLFILVSLIRTIRPHKCWTKTWIIFVFAFLELILGVGLTFGLKFAMPFITETVGKLEVVGATETAAAKTFNDLATGLNASIKTSAYIPSIIYLAFIPLSIVYAIVRHSVKVDYKEYKREKKAAKHAAKAG